MPLSATGVADTFGFSNWSLGIGSVGNFLIWGFLVLIIGGAICGAIIWILNRATYKHKIIVYGIKGRAPMKLWQDEAKEVPIGRAGDRLFYLKKRKRFIPPPEMQIGVSSGIIGAKSEWWFWQREDGELINIGIENLDEKMREMGIHFIHSDMRMQRLGIEKNLQHRLQEEGFWNKHGDKIISFVFYILVFLMLIVLFTQASKIADKFGTIATKLDETISKTQPKVNEPASSGSGIITMALPLMLKGGIG